MNKLSIEEMKVYESAIDDLIFFNLDADYIEIIKEMHTRLKQFNEELLVVIPKLVKEVKSGLYPSEYDEVFESLGINYKEWEQ